jgi:hypothetical protein
MSVGTTQLTCKRKHEGMILGQLLPQYNKIYTTTSTEASSSQVWQRLLHHVHVHYETKP